ncbi:hypothetical protein FHG87_000271 [Trinorchestia longiramus]|nr:hypothetical protein FHG87_000271 [Trinorchestia longiramus]
MLRPSVRDCVILTLTETSERWELKMKNLTVSEVSGPSLMSRIRLAMPAGVTHALKRPSLYTPLCMDLFL